MPARTAVDPDILGSIRAICLALPAVSEEAAWVGTRWVVRTQTFAHVLVIDDGWPPAYAKAFGSTGPLTVLTFQAPAEERDAYRAIGAPFFLPPWRPGIVGFALDDARPIDWSEIGELITDSWCELAPQKLVAELDRPPS